MTLKIIHKRSTDVTGGVSDAPLPTDLEYGEIGINYADADPALFIKDSADVVRRLALNAGGENKKYSVANDDAGLVGADATAAINAALIANGDIADVAELGVSDQCDVTDSGNPDANPEVTVGRYWYDGAVWFLGGGNTLLTVSDTAPSNPIRGQLWVDTNEDPPVVKVWDDTPGPGAWVPVGGDVEEAPIDGNQYARQNATWTPVQGGDNNITYNGASAWGNVAADGTLKDGLNIASVSFTAPNAYNVVFTTPMPSNQYSAVVSTDVGWAVYVEETSKTVNGFNYYGRNDTSGVDIPVGCNFAVFSQNALPPAGTTGTDAWGAVQGNGTLDASYNIASVTRAAIGTYAVAFTTPMPSSDYAVNVTSNSSTEFMSVKAISKTVNGFTVTTQSTNTGGQVDGDFSFTVNATNANLPYTFTKEQIEAAVNNTGSYAWGAVASDGSLLAGNNCQTQFVTTGIYQVTFNTPLPDANYAVSGTAESGANDVALKLLNSVTYPKTASSFYVAIFNEGTASYQNGAYNFTVTAAKGQPLSLGGGADAWGYVSGPGNLVESHNIASATRTGTGKYDVVFATPMPFTFYSVTTGVTSSGQIITDTYSPNGFSVKVLDKTGSSFQDTDFNFAVFATDGNAGGFWGRTNAGVLTPANPTDDVQIASLNGGQLAGFRNVLVNGTVTINQRNATYAGVAVGEYWADRWKKTAGGMTQIIEEGNYKPNTEYTLSGTGVTTQQVTSPAAGDWTIPDVPGTATMIQLEEGPVATPFELRPIGTEFALCQRYYQVGNYFSNVATGGNPIKAPFITSMRESPTMTVTASTNLSSEAVGTNYFSPAAGNDENGFMVYNNNSSVGTIGCTWTADADL